MSFVDMERNAKMQHDLPLGAVVVFRNNMTGDRAKLVIVGHSRDCDKTPLYMASQEPLVYPNPEPPMYSSEEILYRRHAGWFVGNAPRHMFEDTGERVALMPH